MVLRYIAWYAGIALRKTFLGGPRIDLFFDEKFAQVRQYYRSPVLDVGCGRGDFARALADAGLEVACIDVVARCAYPELSFQTYDGTHVPYPDKRFATALAMFILHHADDQRAVLAEMARVTRGHLIVGEDVLENRLDRLFAEAHIRSSEWSQGAKGFHTHAEWLEIFGTLGLRLVDEVRIARHKEPIYPVARRIYVLAVPD